MICDDKTVNGDGKNIWLVVVEMIGEGKNGWLVMVKLNDWWWKHLWLIMHGYG